MSYARRTCFKLKQEMKNDLQSFFFAPNANLVCNAKLTNFRTQWFTIIEKTENSTSNSGLNIFMDKSSFFKKIYKKNLLKRFRQ